MSAQKTPRRKSSSLLSAGELEAMKETLKERRRTSTDPEADVLEKIAEMQPSDRAMAERLHALIKKSVPELTAKTWYGMPAYAKDGDLICFFQSGQKFKTRYATFGFSDKANLDEGEMWPNSYALRKLTPVEEKKILELVKRAIS